MLDPALPTDSPNVLGILRTEQSTDWAWAVGDNEGPQTQPVGSTARMEQMGERIEPFSTPVIEGVAGILGDTNGGFTGSEIARLLTDCGIEDVLPDGTKRIRLRDALVARQRRDGAGNAVVRLISEAMAPVRYANDHVRFHRYQDALNQVLVHVGLKVRDDGQIQRTAQARTLSEAAELANRLRAELNRRGTHREVVRYCSEEVLRQDLFHAVFEASKGLAERIRTMTGLTTDGSVLVDQALAPGKTGTPALAINSLRTETERSEQTGLANLIKGVFGMFRNVTAHAPKITWTISEPDALDLFTTLSLVHRRLDGATPTGSTTG